MDTIEMIRRCGARQEKVAQDATLTLPAPEVPYTPELPKSDHGIEGHLPIGYDATTVWT